MTTDLALTLACPDRVGIAHAVSGYLRDHDCNITESQQYLDPDTGRFFMRVRIAAPDASALDDFVTQVQAPYGMDCHIGDLRQRCPTVVMVSRYGHCLNDLLFRWSTGALAADVVAVVSNHDDLRPLAASYGVPFHHVPVDPADKAPAEAELLRLVRSTGAELVVLARYMQILSDRTCADLEGRVINIHHSFLPSFKGARPYHQAHDRGVKLIGATAHFVTGDLDEGPIIEQEVARVDHTYSPERLAAVGRDLEAQALARAVQWYAERRVLLNGHRTVVFR